MAVIEAAFPFVEVHIDLSGLLPVAQRAPGVIAVAGTTPAGAGGGTAAANTPLVVSGPGDAAEKFAKVTAGGVVTPTPLSSSLSLAFAQDPRPSKIYGVRVDGDDYAAALASLAAVGDVTMVGLADEAAVGAEATNAAAATGLIALRDHVTTMSSQGQKRMGVAMIDPATAKSNTYAADVADAYKGLKTDDSRMVLVAARGATGDAAIAAMAAIAGLPPHVSPTLKPIRGLAVPLEQQYSPAEIKALSEAGINPIIDPELIVGESLHFADARCFTTDARLPFVDMVRTLDHVDFKLKAGLIGQVGNARITKAGLTLVKTRVEGILGSLKRDAVIDDFTVGIPVLDILSLPPSVWTPADDDLVVEARGNRAVTVNLDVKYGPAVHRLNVNLAVSF